LAALLVRASTLGALLAFAVIVLCVLLTLATLGLAPLALAALLARASTLGALLVFAVIVLCVLLTLATLGLAPLALAALVLTTLVLVRHRSPSFMK
jgi:hypothetical protein